MKKIQVSRVKKRRGIKAQMVKPPNPTQALDMLIGIKSRMENRRKKAPNPTTLDHYIVSYDHTGTCLPCA